MRAAADVQAAGQNAFRRHAALHAAAHGLPECRLSMPSRTTAASAVFVVARQSALVLEHELADARALSVRVSEQLFRAMKGKGSAVSFSVSRRIGRRHLQQ